MEEDDTWLIPYSRDEILWARQRPAKLQTPIPAVGDEVMYRHDEWGPVERAQVTAVQPLDDFDDPNLWTVQRHRDGSVAQLEGRPVFRQSSDPRPMVTVRTLVGPRLAIVRCREARLRGEAGWLPLDWAARHRPLPTLLTAAR